MLVIFSAWLKIHPWFLLAFRRGSAFFSLGVLMAFHNLTPFSATTFSFHASYIPMEVIPPPFPTPAHTVFYGTLFMLAIEYWTLTFFVLPTLPTPRASFLSSIKWDNNINFFVDLLCGLSDLRHVKHLEQLLAQSNHSVRDPGCHDCSWLELNNQGTQHSSDSHANGFEKEEVSPATESERESPEKWNVDAESRELMCPDCCPPPRAPEHAILLSREICGWH